MNEQNSSENGANPQQITCGHFWLIHKKNLPRLADLDDDDVYLINAKKDFFSGVYSALSFLKLAIESREEQKNELIGKRAANVCDYKEPVDQSSVEEEMNWLAAELGDNLTEMATKIDELKEECLHEIRTLASNNESN